MSEISDQERLLSRYGRKFARGDVLFREGDAATEAFLVQEGRIRLIKRVGTTERSLRVVRVGDLFGESALRKGMPRNSTAIALTAGAVLALESETFHHVLSNNPTVTGRVIDQLIRRLRDAEDQIEILMVGDAQLKVVVALVKMAQRRLAAAGQTTGPVELRVSPIELSVRVGLDADTVKRVVQQLRASEYVEIVDETVIISDLDAVRELYGLLGVKTQIAGESS